jgi:RNA-directed DNA polymerase
MGASIPMKLLTQLNRIAETAKRSPTYQFKTIAHLINVDLMRHAYGELRKDAAAGLDGVTAKEYGQDLTKKLTDLHERMKQGRYRAQSLRRVYIEKENGKMRPLSILATEDKIAQKAVVEILERIYERDFLPCSFGYRPGRNAWQALQAIDKQITLGKTNFILDADITDYFGSIVRRELMTMLQKRIGDKDFLRLIGKWLKVGAIDDGRLLLTEDGVAQGATISPILANLYLHEVLDLWFEQTVKPRMRGEVALFRFADDFIACFQHGDDAERFHSALQKRFAKYGLTLSEEKTKLIEFGRSAFDKSVRAGKQPDTFNFLGFSHYCGRTRNGKFTVKVKTMRKRLNRALLRMTEWCRRNRHQKINHQWEHLGRVLKGHYNYYGRTFNHRSLKQFYHGTKRLWMKWLGRRGSGPLAWEEFVVILSRYPLPKPRIVKKWTEVPSKQ